MTAIHPCYHRPKSSPNHSQTALTVPVNIPGNLSMTTKPADQHWHCTGTGAANMLPIKPDASYERIDFTDNRPGGARFRLPVLCQDAGTLGISPRSKV